MGVLTDLIVAPLADAKAVATTASNERPWPWEDVKGLGVDDLASIYCLAEAHVPNDPVVPPEWIENPFTKKRVAVTYALRYARAFECIADDGDVVVFRVPPRLVEMLEGFGTAEAADLAKRWTASASKVFGDGPVPPLSEREATTCLERFSAMARCALERKAELLVWVSP